MRLETLLGSSGLLLPRRGFRKGTASLLSENTHSGTALLKSSGPQSADRSLKSTEILIRIESKPKKYLHVFQIRLTDLVFEVVDLYRADEGTDGENGSAVLLGGFVVESTLSV